MNRFTERPWVYEIDCQSSKLRPLFSAFKQFKRAFAKRPVHLQNLVLDEVRNMTRSYIELMLSQHRQSSNDPRRAPR